MLGVGHYSGKDRKPCRRRDGSRKRDDAAAECRERSAGKKRANGDQRGGHRDAEKDPKQRLRRPASVLPPERPTLANFARKPSQGGTGVLPTVRLSPDDRLIDLACPCGTRNNDPDASRLGHQVVPCVALGASSSLAFCPPSSFGTSGQCKPHSGQRSGPIQIPPTKAGSSIGSIVRSS